MNTPGFIPKFGGYKKLLSYQKARVVYKGTVFFIKRWVPRISRTTDQMEQAARSGKQNIVEGSLAAAVSKEMEIKLTGVALASLGELGRVDTSGHATARWPTYAAGTRLCDRRRLA